MRGISIETLAGLREVQNQDAATIITLDWLINVHCQELQEPWMTLEEFFKSGFEGMCWFCTDYNEVSCAYFDKRGVRASITSNTMWTYDGITHVMQIHKPELPR